MNQTTTPQVPGVMLYRHFYEAFAPLDDGTLGRLTRALMEYAFFDVEPKLPPEQEVAWAFMKNYVDRDRANYQAKLQRRRDAVDKRWSRERAKAAETPAPAVAAPHQRPPCVKGKTLPSGERCHTECDREGGGAGSPTGETGGLTQNRTIPPPLTRSPSLSQGRLYCAPPETEPTYDGLRPYRDEKGIIRYK